MTGTVQVFEPPTRTPDKEKTRRRRSFWRKVFLGLSLVLFICAATILYLADFSLTNAGKMISVATVFAKDKALGVPPFKGKTQVNILLLGVDEPERNGVCRSDTIKLISVDLQKERISMLSIPRDTWVTLPDGHGEGRINSAHQLGGKDRTKCVALAKTAVADLLGDLYGQPIHIDRYVRIQTTSFEKVITALGGIDLEVEQQMDYEDPSQNLFIHLKPGYQHLNAKDAVGYVRFRHDAEGDYGRIKRQDKFLRTLAAKVNQPEHKDRLVRLIGPLLEMVSTDLSANDALALKELLGKLGGMDGIQSVELPTVPTMKGAASVVEISDREVAARAIGELLNGPRPTVCVLNGTQRSGLARDVSDAINNDIYNVLGIGTTTQPADISTIYTTEKKRQDAERLAAVLGLPATIINTTAPLPEAKFDKPAIPTTSTPTTAQITIVLGKDFRTAPAISAQLGGSDNTSVPR